MNGRKRVLINGLLLLVCFFSLTAQEKTEGANNGGFVSETSITALAATTMEVQLSLDNVTTFPFLQGHSVLTEGNFVALEPSFAVTPISLNASMGVRFQPLALLQFYAEVTAGSGWNLNGIADGLRLNTPVLDGFGDPTGEANLTGEAFDGFVVGGELGGLFQFDFGAVFPGDWNHVVFQTYNAVLYREYTGAEDGQAWLWQADSGENLNGYSYRGSHFLGYSMPLPLHLAGLAATTTLRLYDSDGGDVWGEDLLKWEIGPVASLSLNETLEISAIVQFKTSPNFTAETEEYGWYQSRVLENRKQSLEFYRAAVIFTYRL